MFSMMIGCPSERTGHVIADDAGNHIGRPARGERHDQRDRASRIVGLRRRAACGKAERRHNGNRARQDTHGHSPLIVSFNVRLTRECYHRAADM